MKDIELAERLERLALGNPAITFADKADLALAAARLRKIAPTNPAPGYCKHCKQYTIEEPLPAAPAPDAATVDQIMALADKQMECGSLCGMMSSSVYEARAALRAAVERVIAEKEKVSALYGLMVDKCNALTVASARLQEHAERAEAERDVFDNGMKLNHAGMLKAEARLAAAEAMLAHAFDNLNDMPISEAWAKKMSERIDAFLTPNAPHVG